MCALRTVGRRKGGREEEEGGADFWSLDRVHADVASRAFSVTRCRGALSHARIHTRP
jgi:hypothetical protein